MNLSKEEFIEYTTQGYPIDLNQSIQERDDFFFLLNKYINDSENEFMSQFSNEDEGIVIFAGDRTEVCKVNYENDRITVYTSAHDINTSFSSGEFNEEETKIILGNAFLGIFTFCKIFEHAVLGKNKIKELFEEDNDKDDVKSPVDKNTKYRPWSL